MDLLLISRCPPFPIHLGDRLIPYHLSQQLASRNYHIDLIAFSDRPDDIVDIPRYERSFRHIQLIREPRRGNLDYLGRVMNPKLMFPERADHSFSPEMWNAIESRLSSFRYDIVYLFGGIQVSEYRNLVKTLPNVIVPYESYSLYLKSALAQDKGAVRKLFRRIQLNMAQSYEKQMFEGFDRTVVLSESDARMLRSLDPHLRINVIPNGVDADYLTPTGHEPDDPTLMFIGNYEYPPNADAAMWLAQKIYPRVKQRVPTARLLLVGNNPTPAMKALSRHDIEVTGRVPDVRPFWEQALIFVSPLRFGAGIKNKLLEAMAMQKPIVATPLSISGIALEENRNILTARHADEFYKQIMRLIKDDDFRRNMGAANRTLVESRYTWRRVTDQYEDLFKQIIRARGQRV